MFFRIVCIYAKIQQEITRFFHKLKFSVELFSVIPVFFSIFYLSSVLAYLILC